MILLDTPVEGDDEIMCQTCCGEVSDEMRRSQIEPRQKMVKIESALHARIRLYIQSRGNPELLGISPFPRGSKDEPTVGDLLYARYRSGASTDGDIVAHASRVAVGHCPYCGLRLRRKPHDESPDRDHIVPRSKYPEFSLLRINLVVACDDCNDVKLDQVFDSAQRWLFVHPYFDKFLASQVLHAGVRIEDGQMIFKFSVRADLPEDIRSRVERHFTTLDLESRYADEPLHNVAMLIAEHKKYIAAGLADVQFVREALRQTGEQEISHRPNNPLGHALLALSQAKGLEAVLGSTPTAP